MNGKQLQKSEQETLWIEIETVLVLLYYDAFIKAILMAIDTVLECFNFT